MLLEQTTSLFNCIRGSIRMKSSAYFFSGGSFILIVSAFFTSLKWFDTGSNKNYFQKFKSQVLKQHLSQEIEELIQQQRYNFMVEGTRFQRYTPNCLSFSLFLFHIQGCNRIVK
jgi:hypothetical protein